MCSPESCKGGIFFLEPEAKQNFLCFIQKEHKKVFFSIIKKRSIKVHEICPEIDFMSTVLRVREGRRNGRRRRK